MRYAQSQAATTKQRFRLNVDLKENAYWVSRQGDKDSFVRDPSPMGNATYLPSGVSFLDVTHPERGKMREGIAYVEFSPRAGRRMRNPSGPGRRGLHPFCPSPGGKTEVTAGYVERKNS